VSDDAEVRLRMLTSDDVEWLTKLDREGSGAYARPHGWNEEKLAAELDEGLWASGSQWGWAVLVDGKPAGYMLVTGLDGQDASMEMRIAPVFRGRGVGREVLRQTADHHFASCGNLERLTGRAHEQNVPMQRAFNAAGFRMEARYRESFVGNDGNRASEWGYALTRTDWEAGRHHADEDGYDLHGLAFVVEENAGQDPHVIQGTIYKFLQEGRRLIARYAGGQVTEGELAGVLVGDLLTYRFVHDLDRRGEHKVATGGGRSRLQRRGDGRLELVNEWSGDDGRHGKQVLVERRAEPS